MKKIYGKIVSNISEKEASLNCLSIKKDRDISDMVEIECLKKELDLLYKFSNMIIRNNHC